ncbi:MAG TPA: 2'-5' RNA ligase family protein [Agriterribacter sp.]|nr:2'-5' RNA ligase family protein [Agriterribacter sp.]
MAASENLYFIALIPQKELQEAITAYKIDFAERFDSKAALKVVPHITLKAPFTLPQNQHQLLIQWFPGLNINSGRFNIELKDFGCFFSKYHPIIFINPVTNTTLYEMQKEIITSFKNNCPGKTHPVDLKFVPHITVAYRDLTPAKFSEAWKEYHHKKYHALFEVNCIYLLQHDGTQWNVISTYPLETGD